MAAEDHDIVARVTRTSGSASTGALAAHVAGACGHVSMDRRLIAQGYRYYAELSDEIPAFFNRRISTGSTTIAITLQGGIDIDGGEDPFSGLTTTAQVRAALDESDHHVSVWRATITIDARMLELHEVADPLFIARHPNEFRAIAEELVSIGILQGHACPICSDE